MDRNQIEAMRNLWRDVNTPLATVAQIEASNAMAEADNFRVLRGCCPSCELLVSLCECHDRENY